MGDVDWTDDVWGALAGPGDSAGGGEAVLFGRIAARMADGRAPDMMGADEEALEVIAGLRGYALVGAGIARGDKQMPMEDPAYFEALRRSAGHLHAAARDDAARDAVALLIASLKDAFDLGRGRRMAGGEQAMIAETPKGLH